MPVSAVQLTVAQWPSRSTPPYHHTSPSFCRASKNTPGSSSEPPRCRMRTKLSISVAYTVLRAPYAPLIAIRRWPSRHSLSSFHAKVTARARPSCATVCGQRAMLDVPSSDQPMPAAPLPARLS